MLPIIIEALVKIGLLIGGLMTAAAYLVLVERWIAAWVQDRRGPNRVGVPLTRIRLFGLGQPVADGGKFLFKAEFTPAHVDKAMLLPRPGDDLRRGDRRVRRDPVRQRAARLLAGRMGLYAADRTGRRAGPRCRHDLRLRRRQHRRLRRRARRLGEQQQIQLSWRACAAARS